MKGLMEREFVAQLVIILCISLGGWAVFVHPKAKKLDQLQSVFDTVPHGSTALGDGTFEDLAVMLSDGQRHVGTIAYRNKLAQNVTLLYGLISELGAKHNVTVQSLTPVSRATAASEKGFKAIRIDMVLEGGFVEIASFVDAVHELPGFIRPVSLSLKPAGNVQEALATASFSCEIVQFEVPVELSSIGVDQP